MKKLIQFFKDVKLELSKVIWPKREAVIKLTLIVFIISGIIAIYTGGLDLLFTKILEFLIARK